MQNQEGNSIQLIWSILTSLQFSFVAFPVWLPAFARESSGLVRIRCTLRAGSTRCGGTSSAHGCANAILSLWPNCGGTARAHWLCETGKTCGTSLAFLWREPWRGKETRLKICLKIVFGFHIRRIYFVVTIKSISNSISSIQSCVN